MNLKKTLIKASLVSLAAGGVVSVYLLLATLAHLLFGKMGVLVTTVMLFAFAIVVLHELVSDAIEKDSL